MPNQRKDPQQTETRMVAIEQQIWKDGMHQSSMQNSSRCDKPYSDINGILHLEATSSLSSAEPAKVEQ